PRATNSRRLPSRRAMAASASLTVGGIIGSVVCLFALLFMTLLSTGAQHWQGRGRSAAAIRQLFVVARHSRSPVAVKAITAGQAAAAVGVLIKQFGRARLPLRAHCRIAPPVAV